MEVRGARMFGEAGGTSAGEGVGEGDGEGVMLSVASTWSCSVGEGVGVATGVFCWGESKPESPDERFCITYTYIYIYTHWEKA